MSLFGCIVGVFRLFGDSGGVSLSSTCRWFVLSSCNVCIVVILFVMSLEYCRDSGEMLYLGSRSEFVSFNVGEIQCLYH